MTDYKSMYYHLAGRTVTAIDVLETTTNIMEVNAKAMISTVESLKISAEAMLSAVKSLTELKEKLKLAQQTTEEIFISGDDENK